jgi:hypothetical protein
VVEVPLARRHGVKAERRSLEDIATPLTARLHRRGRKGLSSAPGEAQS